MGGGRVRTRQNKNYPNGTKVGVIIRKDAWNKWAASTIDLLCDPWYEWPHITSTCWDQTNKRPYVGGGPLRIESSGCNSTVQGIRSSRYSWGYLDEYTGSVTCRVMIPVYNQFGSEGVFTPLPSPSSIPSASNLGPEAWDRYRPGKPIMSLGVSLVELRDFPKMVRQLRSGVRFLRNLGRNAPREIVDQAANQYLGYQFGWKQMVGDIFSVCNFQSRCDSYYRSLMSRNGTWHTRGGTLQREEDTSYTVSGQDTIAVTPLGVPQIGPSKMTYSRGSQTRIWFKGRFKYYMPKVTSAHDMYLIRRRMAGIAVTPDLVWNLMPWTWLLDWHAQFGHAISNLTSGVVDDLVAEYAFIMKQSYHYERTVAEVPFSLWNGMENLPQMATLQGENFTSVKTRHAASPFGFGIDASNYTARQIAILAALGLQG